MNMDKTTLQQIAKIVGQVLDKKLDARFGKFEERIDQKLDARFGEFEVRNDQKLDTRFAEFEKRSIKPIWNELKTIKEITTHLMIKQDEFQQDMIFVKTELLNMNHYLHTKFDEHGRKISEHDKKINQLVA